MKRINKLNKFEFEARIFISFSIVIIVCAISFIFFDGYKPIYKIISYLTGLSNYSYLFFLLASLLMFIISLLRMQAGSLLSSGTVMSFKVQTNSFITSGPYTLVRNPIYFADLAAVCIFSLFMPLTGLLLPLLFYLHYMQLISYEEKSFRKIISKDYNDYLKKVPCLIPTLRSFFKFMKSNSGFSINKDGFRHNALFLLFIPGFAAGYFTDSFLLAVLIGLPGVIDWAIVHTKIGLLRNQTQSKVFKSVLYSQCWEDPEIDRKAFNITEDDVVFSITSGGCNLLAFLIDNPKSIIALDLNPHQNYLLELKMTAYKNLSYDHMLEFIGVRKSFNRIFYFDCIKHALSPDTEFYWEKNMKLIKKGIIHCGRYENYMRLLRASVGILIGRKNIRRIFYSENAAERKRLFERKWENLRWKLFTKILLSRKTMSLLFDKAFFKHLKEDLSFGDHFAGKVKRAFTVLPVKENYFLRYILFGNYDECCLPVYLRKDNFEIIKSRLNRIKIVTGSCEDLFKSLSDNSISKFNFTNIFEWIPDEAFENLLKETIRVAKNKAVITYRNLLVPRKHPNTLKENIISQKELASRLFNRDLSFVYDNYVVEKIIKEEKKWDIKLSPYQLEVH
ncbi:MAG TPA: DUF3419 family protein [Ignavibacteriaceae bacterium]|nr:DUF3419 family protein [Ignavibacteriaceae bacterium]